MIFLSHPTGNANVRGALAGFHQAGMLQAFATTIATFEGNLFGRMAKTRMGSEFNRRRYPEALRPLTRAYPARELVRLIAAQRGWDRLIAAECGPFSIDKVCAHLDQKSARNLQQLLPQLRAVYGYEDIACQTFTAAKALGLKTLYDLPIGYWRAARRIQSEEAGLQPEWASTIAALRDSDQKLARKDEELHKADAIIVASSFTAMTLQDAPFDLPQPAIIPYGCPEVAREAPSCGATDKLRVLFVGGLSQRKGLSYLLEAVDKVGSACELTLVGRRPQGSCPPLDAALRQHRWIPSMPHAKILETMRNSDVLVFPSLFEGFGLVVTEALSQGIPVITTAHTCGPDVLSDELDGFIVPIRDSDAIAERLEQLHRDPERLRSMKAAARAKALTLSWASYGQQLARYVKEQCQ